MARPERPRLYPSAADEEAVKEYQQSPYITISPASVWFTKQCPAEKWIAFLRQLTPAYTVYLLGGPGDADLAANIQQGAPHLKVISLCGKLNFLQSTARMKQAVMNYVNDFAPMHFASSVNAPVTAVYCSTLPSSFGFPDLVRQTIYCRSERTLPCRPCGLHGRKPVRSATSNVLTTYRKPNCWKSACLGGTMRNLMSAFGYNTIGCTLRYKYCSSFFAKAVFRLFHLCLHLPNGYPVYR